MTEEELAALHAKRGSRAPAAVSVPAKQTLQETHQAKGRLKDGEMTKLEREYAAYLDQQKLAGAIKWWAFERIKIKIAKNTHITLDFFVMTDLDELQARDTKANRKAVTDDALAKTKVAAELCPWPFFYVYPRDDGGWDMERIGR
ncbi:hypothetical protein QYH69_32165 [Paraburkholderia sp. SARCC-3016]|uniref:hypothetical protein n=1 Tax=Paraburkholderia sp. SARCC-3016 TaxID=3058611 RepID=UPI002806EE14|nr:hypothetical protein [Paraburkholderia sp. SARCC-3016]MDQ7981879.1 hypothetical protein [Paraburkholderia sp. SARCC-3016]